MDSHSDYSTHLRVVQYCFGYTGTVESIGEYILEQSSSVRAVPELIVGESGKVSSPFCIPLAKPNNVILYK